eukprot:767489-Hanusia_phi.AAC.2
MAAAARPALKPLNLRENWPGTVHRSRIRSSFSTSESKLHGLLKLFCRGQALPPQGRESRRPGLGQEVHCSHASVARPIIFKFTVLLLDPAYP